MLPRPRSARSAPPTALAGATWEDEVSPDSLPGASPTGTSPLAALVAAAADAGVVDPRALGERLGMSASALHDALEDPERLTREQRDALAAAIGVARAVVQQACEAASRAARAVAELPEAQPRTLVELLERTVAAVTDDALGRRVRLSLLTTVQTAAAEVGRPVPPEVHELRARVQRGAVPWIGDGGVFVDAPNASADRELLDAVAAAVRAAQREGSGYDDLFSPVHDDALDALLRRNTAAVRPAAFGASSACVVTPPLFGRHLVVISADAPADQRRVALRRALAHVLCGHVGEFTPLPLPAPAAVTRAADLFALADLVPFWQLHDWRRGARLGWRAVAGLTARAAAALAGDWDDARAAEAARLRVLLYRERSL